MPPRPAPAQRQEVQEHADGVAQKMDFGGGVVVPAHGKELLGSIVPDHERHLLGIDLGQLSGCPARERTVEESGVQACNRDAGDTDRSLRIEKAT